MATCDMCGKDAFLFKAEIENVMMSVCKECGKFGRVLGAAKAEIKVKKQVVRQEAELQESIAADFSKKIREKREQLKMTQEEFANMIKERLSTLQKMESGSFKPDLETARRLERMLKIKLIEITESQEVKKSSGGKLPQMTIGDLLAKK